MAQVSAYLSHITPPPPIYSQISQRSQSPQIPTPPDDTAASNLINYGASANNTARPASRRKSSYGPMTYIDYSYRQSPTAPDRILSPASRLTPDTPSVSVEDFGPLDLQNELALDNRRAIQPPPDHDRLSPVIQNLPRRKALQARNQNSSESQHKRVPSDNSQTSYSNPGHPCKSRPTGHSSAPVLEDGSSPNSFQPLQYHHQLFKDDMQSVDKWASKLTIRSNLSDGSSQNDRYSRSHQYDSSDLRQSMYGPSLQRPDSAFSSNSDLRGRSPQLSPNNHARATSAHSRSPDVRPLSYIDLLNVPYPQAPPSGAENLINSQLRAAVGTNASLLSTRKTLEMYRANIKKTTDPAVQYEFAIFLVSAAQESNIEDEVSVSGVSEKSSGSIQGDLLREAKHILQRLSDRSYPFAQYYLADGLASGLFNKGKEDYDRAFPFFLAASKHGHAEAGYRTALSYEYGWGCRVDAAKAVQFYQHAASKNHPGAMLRLARGCLMGDMGLGKKYKEGIRWLKRAAESADFQYNQAPYELGVLHESGFGDDVFRDESYAAQLFTKSADLGHAEANYRLGDAYEHGKLNCPRDPALSVHFYTGAAQQGHAMAQMALCAWYLVGAEPVLEKDENEAYEWAKRAAETGFSKAEYTVGYFTEMGIGCRRDPLEANVWYVRAADSGDERAKHRIAAIRAAATGANPVTAASGKKGKLTPSTSAGNVGANVDGEKIKKRFGIF